MNADTTPEDLRALAGQFTGDTKELLKTAANMCDSYLNYTAILDSRPPLFAGRAEIVCPDCHKTTVFPTYCKTQEELDKSAKDRLYTCKCGKESSIEGVRFSS